MSKRRKVNNLASQQFYKFEKWILAEKSLKKLSPTAKLLYMVLCDREQLSLKNYKDFTDKEGCLFQYFDQEKASELLGVSLTAIKKAFKDLQEFKLIESVRQGLGKPNRLYILEFEVTEDTLKELSYENKKASTVPPVKADNKNNDFNNSIPQNNKKYTSKKEENKVLNNKHNNTVKNTFTEYEAKELEMKLQKSQEERLGYSQFNPNYKLKSQ